jgi:ADP-heptose:LPS heptosyltransferase
MNRYSSILVYVGLDLVGDALMKLPFVRALRATYPDARITWLAGKGKTAFAGPLAPLVVGQIDEVIESAGIGTHWHEVLRRPLPGRRFDLLIDTQRRVLTTLILRRIACGTFVSGAANFALSDLKPRGAYRKPAMMIRQILDLLEIASGASIVEPDVSNIDATFARRAAELLPEGPLYVGFAPGAGGRHKCWPLDRYVAVAKRQADVGRLPVFILGPDEADWRADLGAAVPGALFPLQDARNGPADKSPLLTIALAARLRVAVSNDSGGGHLLAAGGVPLVSLWGPTVFEKARPQTKILRTILARDFGGTAMTLIPVDAVEAAIEALLAGAGQPSGAIAAGASTPTRSGGG